MLLVGDEWYTDVNSYFHNPKIATGTVRFYIFEISPMGILNLQIFAAAAAGNFDLQIPVNNLKIFIFSRLQRAYMNCRFSTIAQTSLEIFYSSPKFSSAADFSEWIVETFYNIFYQF